MRDRPTQSQPEPDPTDRDVLDEPEADSPEVDPVLAPGADSEVDGETVPDTGAPLEGRERLLRALRKPGKAQLGVAVLLALLGLAAVTQVRSTELDDTYAGRREEDLIEILNGLTGTSDRARREIAELERTRADLRNDSRARQAAIESAEERLATLNILAGLVPVTGPGLRITITGGPEGIRSDSLLDLIQELRTAGAEAMEFEGLVRLAVQSSFSETEAGLAVDGVPLGDPVVLEVIGEPRTLYDGLRFPSGPIADIEENEGGRVDVDELDAVKIETVRQLPQAEYAESTEGQ